ncbi:MAG TPA: SatD family protein [Gemmatimonadales bacterium]|nr:SatD family protein [Gemmatimonadales bacterium]
MSRGEPRRRLAETPRAEAPRRSIAVIGDLVASRRVAQAERSLLQRELERLVATLNKRYRHAIAARFLVTLGDEFQGVLQRADAIPDLIWDIETGLPDVDVRLGIGFGTLLPPFKPLALGMDGPAFHAAREAIEFARKRRVHGGVFIGFGATEDAVLNGLARLLRHEREGLSKAQLATLARLRQGHSQAEIAKELRLTRQAVSSRARSAAWEAFSEGERVWRAVLTGFDVSGEWQRGSR